jgi:EmrB/QacA subfamily drug resistance transporter
VSAKTGERVGAGASAVVPAADDGSSRARLWLLFTALALALLLSELDQTVFATALPTVVGELSGVQDMLWVGTAYMLAGTVALPVYGKLSDLLGRKPVLITGMLVFVAGSVLGGLSTDMGTLIAARAIQGLGGGGLIVLVQSVVADTVPARDRAPYLSAIGAVFALSAVAGPVVGGWLTEGVGWRWAFWVNLPLGGLAVLAVAVLLRHEPPRRDEPVQLDVAGTTTLAVAVTALVLLVSWGGTRLSWTSPAALGLAALTLASAVVFVLVERRAVEPVIPLQLFADRTFTAAVVAGLVMAVAMFGTLGYLPTYLQMAAGLAPTAAGMAMLTLVAGLALATVGAAQLVKRTGRTKVLPLVGTGLVAVALGLLATLTPGTPLPLAGLYLLLLGLGIGCAWEVLVVVVQNTAPDAAVGTATATNSFFREIGVCLGSALVGALFTARLGALLADRVPAADGVDVDSLTPALAEGLPPAVRAAVAGAYNDALTPVFALLVPVVLASTVLLLLVREVPLATTAAEPGGEPAQRLE